MNSLINLLKTPKTQLGIFLTLIFITAFINNPSQKALLTFLLSIVSTVTSDLLFVKLRRVKPFFPSASLVTGSIIGLLTSPVVQWYIPIAIAAAAMFSKNFIRFSNRHIFNPAGFGLVVSALIFSHAISWWGVSFQQLSTLSPREAGNFQLLISFLILLAPGLISLYRMRRYRITATFLLAYILINKIFNFQFSTFNLILDPTLLFFSIVMLPEPMTSPNNHLKQILFGIFVAIISLIVSSPTFNPSTSLRTGFQLSTLNSIDPLIFSLLLGNLAFFKLR